jgi:hypothetical protein
MSMVLWVEFVEIHLSLVARSKWRVYINKDQWFEGVQPEVWESHIGGYQVCEKWLKDRRGAEIGV